MPIGEKSLIRQIRAQSPSGRAVAAGIGDDCAVLRPPAGHELLVTTDFTLENVHFRQNWHPPEVVGRRCITRGLSDIAAMGGEPLAAFLSLALPRKIDQSWVNGFLRGLLAAGSEFRVPLAGGDTAQSPGGVQADIVVVGSVPKGRAVMRSAARPGDGIYVTGELGGSAAALAELRAGNVRAGDYPRHFHPTARVRAGTWLRRRGMVHAMIDISDGLSTDLLHICEASGVAAEVEAEAVPRARVGRRKSEVPLNLALHGGEDYELLFTASARIPSRIAGVAVTRIGTVIKSRRPGMSLVSADGLRRKLEAQGWEHFRK